MAYYDAIIKVRIDKETLKQLKALAKQQNLKVSELIRELIYREIKRQRIKESIAKQLPNIEAYMQNDVYREKATQILNYLQKIYKKLHEV